MKALARGEKYATDCEIETLVRVPSAFVMRLPPSECATTP